MIDVCDTSHNYTVIIDTFITATNGRLYLKYMYTRPHEIGLFPVSQALTKVVGWSGFLFLAHSLSV